MPAAIQSIILTPDLDRLAAFYRALLGAEETNRVPPEGPTFFVELRIGEGELGLVSNEKVGIGTDQRLLISVTVEDVDALLDRVERLGGQVLGPPNDMPWGQRVAHIKDPDGNRVNLSQPLEQAP
ncbi:VOC family protein [Actinomycetota bacterium Odt1-20B]